MDGLKKPQTLILMNSNEFTVYHIISPLQVQHGEKEEVKAIQTDPQMS